MCPGLHHYTALLPLIPLEELSEHVPVPIGTNTRAAMRSGLYWGQVGAVKELLAQGKQALGAEDALVLVTGGGGAMLKQELPSTAGCRISRCKAWPWSWNPFAAIRSELDVQPKSSGHRPKGGPP